MAKISHTNAVIFILASVALTSAAQLLFKLGMLDTALTAHTSLSFADATSALLATANLPALAIGTIFYATSMLVWILALTRFPVSVAYPVLSISYVVVYFVATSLTVFGESGSTTKLAGVAFVVAGISIMFSGRRS